MKKNDLNSTDLHTYILPLSQAVPPCWESKSDWEIFKSIAKKVSELAGAHFVKPFRDIVCSPLQHDSTDEIAQSEVKDWAKGECEPLPGKTMSHLRVVERDYVNLYQRFISLGPLARQNGIGAHGVRWGIQEFYDQLLRSHPVQEWNGNKYPSLDDAKEAANVILYLAPETNGDMAPGIFSLLLPLSLAGWGLQGSYLAWLLFLAVGIVIYIATGRNACYFQLLDDGVSPTEAREKARTVG